MRGFCFPSTRWEIRTRSTTLDADGRGKLLDSNPRRILAIFANLSLGSVGIINKFSPEIFADCPFVLGNNADVTISGFDYGDVVADSWYGAGALSDVINATELLPTSSSPLIKLTPPKLDLPTDFRRCPQTQVFPNTEMDIRNSQRVALVIACSSGTYELGFEFPISSANAVFSRPGPFTITLLFNDYGPMIWERWWGRDTSGSGSTPTFFEVVWIPEPITECVGA